MNSQAQENIVMKSLLRLLLKTYFKPNRSKVDRTVSGFTLIELLVAMIMTFLILTPLLGFVVDVLNTDRKEQVKSNTEQEIQAALNFIAEDLGQAIYIYDNQGINTGDANNNKLEIDCPTLSTIPLELLSWYFGSDS